MDETTTLLHGLYSYTYSAGLTIGTQMCLNILKDNSKANDWIEVLKAEEAKILLIWRKWQVLMLSN